MYKDLTRYFSYNVTTLQQYQEATFLELPSITICNHNLVRKSYINKLSQENLGQVFKFFTPYFAQAKLDTLKILQTITENNVNSQNLENIGRDGAHQFDEMILLLKIGQTLKTYPDGIHKSRFTQGGYCHTIHPKSFIDKYGSIKINRAGIKGGVAMLVNISENDYFASVEGSSGLKILVHAPYDEPLMNEVSLSIPPGSHVKIMIQKKEIIDLPFPYGSSHCVDTESDSFMNPLKLYGVYSYNACTMECLVNYLWMQCGCRLLFYHTPKVPVCNAEQTLLCAINATVTYYDTFSLEAACDCHHRCHKTKFAASISLSHFPSKDLDYEHVTNRSIVDDKLSFVNIFYGELGTEVLHQVPSYPFEAAFGEIGGQLGICLGASVLTLIEFIEFFTISCCICARRKT